MYTCTSIRGPLVYTHIRDYRCGTYTLKEPMQMFHTHLLVNDPRIDQSCSVEVIVFMNEKEEVCVRNELLWIRTH
jgi:hypothetical protein